MANPWNSFNFFPDRVASIIETNTITPSAISQGRRTSADFTSTITMLAERLANSRGVARGPGSYFADPIISVSPIDPNQMDWESATLVDLIHFLHSQALREKALSCLFKMSKNQIEEVAVNLWQSFRGVRILLHEVTLIENKIAAGRYEIRDFTRALHALSLLQCLAYHSETKMFFLSVNAPEYLYPLLQYTEDEPHIKSIKNASLRTLAALVEVDGPTAQHAVHHFIERGVHVQFLKCIENGDLISRTLATYIMTKILMQEEGLHFIGNFFEQFLKVVNAYDAAVEKMEDAPPSPHLLRNIIQSYFRMAQTPRACDALRLYLPWRLRTGPFVVALANDPQAKQRLDGLFSLVAQGHQAFIQPAENLEQMGQLVIQ